MSENIEGNLPPKECKEFNEDTILKTFNHYLGIEQIKIPSPSDIEKVSPIIFSDDKQDDKHLLCEIFLVQQHDAVDCQVPIS